MKKLLTLLFMLIPMLSWADSVKIDGIWYKINKEAKVAEVMSTSRGDADSGSIIIPEAVEYEGVIYSVTSIGDYAFWECSGLTSIVIPNSVTSIGNSTFFSCSGLTSVTIPSSVTSIGTSAFSRCIRLTSVTIPNSVTSIGACAFSGCSGLTSVTIGNSVTSIGNGAFEDCSGLTSIDIPNSVTSIGDGAFYGCKGLTSITIPNSVTSIGNSAFYKCSGLTYITIPNSVTSIGRDAFYGCSGLTSVIIGNSVTSIGQYAFMSCSAIREIRCNASVPPKIEKDTFKGLNTTHVRLYVPKGCYDAYAFAQGWDAFLNIIEEGEGNDGDSELKKLQAAYDELKTKYDALLKGDLNMDGRTDIEDVVTLITLDAYSGDADTFATLTDANSITVEEIGQRFGDVEYYKLNGVKVDKPTQSGVYLVKKDGQTKMVVVKK